MKDGGEKVLMRIFIGESDRHMHRPLYEAHVELFRKEGFAGATVLRGVSGFCAHSVCHTVKLLRLSTDMPLVIEVVDSQEKVDAVMSQVDEMMDGGPDHHGEGQGDPLHPSQGREVIVRGAHDLFRPAGCESRREARGGLPGYQTLQITTHRSHV